jgi:hypothetical protein
MIFPFEDHRIGVQGLWHIFNKTLKEIFQYPTMMQGHSLTQS